MPRTGRLLRTTDVREPELSHGAAAPRDAEDDRQEEASPSGHALFVVPNKRGDGFRASIRGHMFELADPEAAEGIVPTPEDLLAVAIASDVAWSARSFLREQGLDDYVSVSARVWADDGRPGGVDVTVDVSGAAAGTGALLTAALEHRAAALSRRSARLRVRRA